MAGELQVVGPAGLVALRDRAQLTSFDPLGALAVLIGRDQCLLRHVELTHHRAQVEHAAGRRDELDTVALERPELEAVDGVEPLAERQLRVVVAARLWPQQRTAWAGLRPR